VPRHRQFALGPPPTKADEVTFELTGQFTSDDTQTWSEHFACIGLAPAGALDDLTTSITISPTTGARRYDTLSCMAFLRQVLVPEDRERFEALAHDGDRIVGLIDLVGIVAWLSDELTLRPTRPSSVSGAGGERRDGEATPVGAAT
jgi:hypothetical protein